VALTIFDRLLAREKFTGDVDEGLRESEGGREGSRQAGGRAGRECGLGATLAAVWAHGRGQGLASLANLLPLAQSALFGRVQTLADFLAAPEFHGDFNRSIRRSVANCIFCK